MAKIEKNKPSKTITPSKYTKMQDTFVKHNKDFFATGMAKDVFQSISHGDNSYLRINRVETSAFDKTWIEHIEDCIPDLEEIINNPRKTIATEGNVVPVELAKKTNSESVRHLATHTQFVKEIKENGDVIPSKILTMSNEDFYSTYENRFIATLIRRLMLFIEKRYEFIVEHALLKNTEELRMKSRSIIDGSVVEMETKVKVVKPADYDGVEEKNSFVDRISNVRDHLRYCYTSQFMKMLKTEKNVRNPILMTNIIRKNPKYHKCYLLWKYLEGYTSAGVTYSVNDSTIDINQEMIAEINAALTASFLAVRSSEPSQYSFVKERTYKPKILRSLDDEQFEFGPYVAGPVEFVRVDEAFRKATEQTTSIYREEDVYDKPRDYQPKRDKIHGLLSREEEEYIKDLRLENHAIELLREAKDQLMSRKRREAVAFEKVALKNIQLRAAEEREHRAKLARDELLRQLVTEKEAIDRLIQRALNDMMDKTPSIEIPEPIDEEPIIEVPEFVEPAEIPEPVINVPDEIKDVQIKTPEPVIKVPTESEIKKEPIPVPTESEPKKEPVKVPVPAPKVEEKKDLSLKESMDVAKNTATKVTMSKRALADWLQATYNDKVNVNVRDDKTSTGLPLADTHYFDFDGTPKCFIYVYSLEGKCFFIVRSDEDTAKVIRLMGHKFVSSAFPKTRDNAKWYTMLIDNSYRSSYELYSILEIVIARLKNNKYQSKPIVGVDKSLEFIRKEPANPGQK